MAHKLRSLPSRLSSFPSRLRTASIASSWRTGKTTAERGYDNRWRRARAAFLREHPLCARCEAKGRVTAATVVDHREPHRGDPHLFWDPDNWDALCASCHSSNKQSEERRPSGGWSRT